MLRVSRMDDAQVGEGRIAIPPKNGSNQIMGSRDSVLGGACYKIGTNGRAWPFSGWLVGNGRSKFLIVAPSLMPESKF